MARDEGLGHRKICVSLKEKQRKASSFKLDSSHTLWDSPESDTESLAQERAYQQDLQDRLDCNTDTMIVQPKEEDMYSLQQDEEEDEQDEEGLCVYDSLEVTAAHRLGQRNSSQSSMEVHHAHQMNGNKVCRVATSDDSYADLRYDPDWRTNLTGGWRSAGRRAPLSPEEGPRGVEEADETSGGRGGEREADSSRGRYGYVLTKSPALAENTLPDTEGDRFESPHPLESYHLHIEEDQQRRDVSLVSPRRLHDLAAGRGPAEATPPRTNAPSERGPAVTSHRKVQAERVEPNLTYADQNPSSSSEADDSYGETRDRRVREGRTVCEDEEGQTCESANERRSEGSSKAKSRSRRKSEKPREDIIERNRMTLGINSVKQGGSYLKTHSHKGETSETSHQVTDATEEITADGGHDESLEDHSDPEMRWLQKTQQLKVTQSSREKRGRHRGNPPEKRPKAGQRACLSPLAPRPAAGPHPDPQPDPRPPRHPPPPPPVPLGDGDSRSSGTPQRGATTHPAPSTIHLNINLNAASDPQAFLSRQDAVITLTSPRGPPTLEPGPPDYSDSLFADDPRVPIPYGRQGQTVVLVARQPALTSDLSRLGGPGRPGPSQGRRGVTDPLPLVWHQSTPASWQNHTSPRLAATRQRSPDPSRHDQRSREEEEERSDEESRSYMPAAAATPRPPRPGSYVTLPPIGTSMTGRHGRSQGTSSTRERNPMQRSSSDGYLAQLEKQKQLKEKISYKAYTLKDYKRLKQDVNLGGLGPDNTASDITVEKMRRRRLYSDVIRQQNKKRTPVLPASNPAGDDRKDQVSREKALEYARTIARPVAPAKPPPKPRGHQGSEGVVSQPAGYLDGLDLSQLATLEFLRKRHEEEKQAVASFKALHAV